MTRGISPRPNWRSARRNGAACAACHASSDPASETPRLAGQNEGYLARQLRAFRGGERAHPLMDEITRQLSDADIDDLAAFWSRQPVGSDAAVPLLPLRLPPHSPLNLRLLPVVLLSLLLLLVLFLVLFFRRYRYGCGGRGHEPH